METWLEVLQAEVAASSLAQVAEKLGLSRTTISQVCNEKYPGASVSRAPTPWPQRSGQQSDGYQALEGMPQRLPP
ncbi:helix-turn-helix domain-containing protein [Aeromonas veronii]|uniref:helix-turn-helix domain-containing protein n=1 Tax=Aeromonas veronii TaxID=654 RepID=UPI001F46E78D|nr:helix-turn-helix transcriptional regulator [Aeromonas veronii]